MKKTSVRLLDVDLVKLRDSADPEVVAAAASAEERLAWQTLLGSIPAHVAQLVSDVIAEDVRARKVAGERTVDIARMHGISRASVHAVVTGLIWRTP